MPHGGPLGKHANPHVLPEGSFNKSSTVHPSAFAISGSLSALGNALPVSQLAIVDCGTEIISESRICEIPAASRSFLIFTSSPLPCLFY